MCGVLAVIGKREPLDLHHCSRALEGLRLRGPDFSFEELVLDGRLFQELSNVHIRGETRIWVLENALSSPTKPL